MLCLAHAVRLDAELEKRCVLIEVEEIAHVTAGVRSQESGCGQEGECTVRDCSSFDEPPEKRRQARQMRIGQAVVEARQVLEALRMGDPGVRRGLPGQLVEMP